MSGSTYPTRSLGSGNGSVPQANGSAMAGSAPRVRVRRYLHRATAPLVPLRRTLFGASYADLLRYEVREFFHLQHWQRGLTEAILTGLWTFGSILIICASPDWGTIVPARKFLVSGLLHAVMFFIYLPTSSGKDSSTMGTSFRVHLNPAITLMLMLRGFTGLIEGLLIIVSQCGGGVVGALAARQLVTPERRDQFLLGGCFHFQRQLVDGVLTHVGYSDHQGFLADFVFSFTFLYVSMMVTHPKQLNLLGPIVVILIIAINSGFQIYISALLQKGYSGSMYNPARCLGSAVAYGQPLWDRLWVPFLAPLVAAAAAAFMSFVGPPDYPEARVERRDVFSKVGTLFDDNHEARNPGGDVDPDLERDGNTVYDVPSAGRRLPESPQTPDLRQAPGSGRPNINGSNFGSEIRN